MRQAETPSTPRNRLSGRRIYAMPPPSVSMTGGSEQYGTHDGFWIEACGQAVGRGFDMLSVPLEHFDEPGALVACATACRSAGLALMIDVPPQRLSHGLDPSSLEAFADAIPEDQEFALLLRGVAAYAMDRLQEQIEALRRRYRGVCVTIWTPGMTASQVAALQSLRPDAVYSSLPWWDFRAAWLVEEHERLRMVAEVIAPIADARDMPPPNLGVASLSRRLAAATIVGTSVLVPATCLAGHSSDILEDLPPLRNVEGASNSLRRLTGSLARVTALFKDGPELRLLLINPDDAHPASIDCDLIDRRLPDGVVLDSLDPAQHELAPGSWKQLQLVRTARIAKLGSTSSQQRRGLTQAMRSSRIAIEAVQPVVDGGAFGPKRILGQNVVITANIFMDGHEELRAEVLWRPVDESSWRHTPMVAKGNDAWEARIVPRRLGRYVFAICAWKDDWRSFSVQLQKKYAAAANLSLEVEEARHALAEYLDKGERRHPEAAAVVRAALEVLGPPSAETRTPMRRRTRAAAANTDAALAEERLELPPHTDQQIEALLSAELAAAIDTIGARSFEVQTEQEFPLCIERSEAAFGSWYELFPRSQSPEEGRHGTFRDVIGKLPMIRDMGFDVLYFPPIHPIGHRNRKGRNNSLQAGPGDPGSPYAIGAAEGGHDAVHPELGTLDDFRALVDAAREHELEIALDFAIQCSPDHPWLRENPDWFNWRVDGSLKYAENPPKKYEDIVNPDFYSPLASTPRQAALWRALRDVILFWVGQGVRIFRVDNPHTKPLPFWQWMIGEVRDRHPDVIFLSEAFTRPAMMYRLAKVGFSQSYTYFTWRNTKYELTSYMEELNSAPVRDIFRPNFFVNTPDINPWFLQSSGRAGFLIRAALATTLSGSWGMYNGFELCVSEPVPGKEEYLDSEKYQLRRWDMNAPGNIIPEITRLNRIRRSHPALQSHLGIRFHEVNNDQILFYSRHSEEGDSIVLVAVSLDPHHRQTGVLKLARREWGLEDHAPLPLHDLFEDTRFTLQGHDQHITLTPDRPFVLWAIVANTGVST